MSLDTPSSPAGERKEERSPDPSLGDEVPSALAASGIKETSEKLGRLIDNLERVILGKRDALRLCVVALIAEGHVLLEDVPGTGKTTLARALARSIDVEFKRIQFTSDLLPSDVLGVALPSTTGGSFVLQRGPIFGNIVLADELNRTSPRTQSALLECMNENRVSIDGDTHQLPNPFLVIATQNPVEFEGTYPLPESQLDRFLLRLRLGYPSKQVERELMLSRLACDPLESLQAVISGPDILAASREVSRVRIDDSLLEYAIEFLEATRRPNEFLLGASPRAGLAWLRAARALALVEGRDYCVPDDFKALAIPVLGHRVVPLAPSSSANVERAGDDAIADLLDRITVPD